MTHFKSIEKIDTAILYILELASSLSVLLLTFGLIASMANVLTKGNVLTDNPTMQVLWSWSQCLAIDASLPGIILRTFRYYEQKEYVKAIMYTILSVLVLFTAGVVNGIEAVQQTLNVTLDSAYTHIFVPLQLLIWIRSIVIVLLIVCHSLKYVGATEPEPVQKTTPKRVSPVSPQASTVVIPVQQDQLTVEDKKIKALPVRTDNDNYERVKQYLGEYPNASARTVGKALTISASTANKWIRKVREDIGS